MNKLADKLCRWFWNLFEIHQCPICGSRFNDNRKNKKIFLTQLQTKHSRAWGLYTCGSSSCNDVAEEHNKALCLTLA